MEWKPQFLLILWPHKIDVCLKEKHFAECFGTSYVEYYTFFCVFNLSKRAGKKMSQKFPKAIYLIFGSEFCERFSFAGMSGMSFNIFTMSEII